MQKIFYVLLLSAFVMASCSKKNVDPSDPDQPSKTGSTLDLIKDSVFLYSKEVYYWNDALPTYANFRPRSFTGTNDLDALSKEVDALSQYKVDPATGKAYEYYEAAPGTAKYSFIDDGTVSSELNGVKGDFGFAPIYIGLNDLRVRYVYPGSPADQAGLKRGYQITAINGRTSLTYDANSGSGTNVNFVINAYSNSTNITMTVKRPDGSTFNTSMNVATYTLNPVLKSQVFTLSNNRKVGYIVFNSFTSLENATPQLNAAFADFQAQNITDLVVDLRYNGGGYVETADYLSNIIAPTSVSGTVMYKTYYTPNLVNNKAPILKNQVRRDGKDLYTLFDVDYSLASPFNNVNFTKTNIPVNLNKLSNVFFIVTGSTASASELTINNLRTINDLNVKLIGTTTYGKPVGFFDIKINKYELYVPEFETKNSKDQGGYYFGMTPGTSQYPGINDGDDVTKDFGDPTEQLLSQALKYVNTGTFNTANKQVQSLSRSVFSIDEQREAGIKLDGGKFNGMILNKHLKRN
jgi:carboxyl-terminal processing protease